MLQNTQQNKTRVPECVLFLYWSFMGKSVATKFFLMAVLVLFVKKLLTFKQVFLFIVLLWIRIKKPLPDDLYI